MIDFIKRIFTSRPARIVYAFALFFGWFAALATGIALPIVAGYWFWAIPITAAVIVSAPTYVKAIKWCLSYGGDC